MMEVVRLLVLVVSLIRACEGYGTGAPAEACVTMTPGHLYGQNESRPISPQTGDPPFTVTLNVDEYGKHGTIYVTMAGNPTFQGFLIQARADGEDKPVGEFSEFDEAKMKTVPDCSDAYPEGTLTHTANSRWDDSFTVTWTAPSEGVGNITFYWTVAQDHERFWVMLTTDTISGFAVFHPTMSMLLLPISAVISRLI